MALARALIKRRQVLLLGELLSALDPFLRIKMRGAAIQLSAPDAVAKDKVQSVVLSCDGLVEVLRVTGDGICLRLIDGVRTAVQIGSLLWTQPAIDQTPAHAFPLAPFQRAHPFSRVDLAGGSPDTFGRSETSRQILQRSAGWQAPGWRPALQRQRDRSAKPPSPHLQAAGQSSHPPHSKARFCSRAGTVGWW